MTVEARRHGRMYLRRSAVPRRHQQPPATRMPDTDDRAPGIVSKDLGDPLRAGGQA